MAMNVVPKPEPEALELRAEVRDLKFHYGDFEALKGISLPIYNNRVTAIIGGSGCGKSTLLRCFNRMHDLYPDTHYGGEILLHPDEVNLISPEIDPLLIRLKIGMVFQKPNPFPKSIFDNVAAGLRARGISRRGILEEAVEEALRSAALWDEVNGRLDDAAFGLSGGQQQRLCIARTLATNPEIILLDEPTSALDPIATARIEDLIREISPKVTVIIVTHNMQQASRVSDFTAFMHLGELIEFSPTEDLFTNPREQQTEDYISGRFG